MHKSTNSNQFTCNVKLHLKYGVWKIRFQLYHLQPVPRISTYRLECLKKSHIIKNKEKKNTPAYYKQRFCTFCTYKHAEAITHTYRNLFIHVTLKYEWILISE